MKYKKFLAMVLSAVIVANSTMPALATESTQDIVVTYEEEVENETYETSAVANGYLASGFVENDKGGVSWYIDYNRHIVISGKGEYLKDGKTPWYWYKDDFESATVVLTDITDCSNLFSGSNNLTEVDLSGLDTSQVTNMSGMFRGCTALETLDLSELYTGQVTDMSEMFYACQSLKNLNISNLDTSQVTDMSRMFKECLRLASIDVSGLETNQVTNMSEMFFRCADMKKLDLSGFDTSQVTDMSGMFQECYSLTEVDLSEFDTRQVTNMSHMFDSCGDLISLDISAFDTSQVTDMSYMFNWCESLTELDLTGFDTSQVTNMSYMFYWCPRIKNLDLSEFNTRQVTDMASMFEWCSSLTNLDIGGFDTSLVRDMSAMFCQCELLTNLDLSGFDTSQVTNMSYMFYACKALMKLDLNKFDTSQVTDMSAMFGHCTSLENLDVSGFNISQVTNMSKMFEHVHKLTELDLRSFDENKVTDMSEMFSGCYVLKDLNISNLDTSYLKTAKSMFNECQSLTILDVSSFDTSSLTSALWMFSGCNSLKELNMSGFDLSKVSYSSSMLNGCSNLEKIRTPINVPISANIGLIGEWFSSDGTQWANLPEELGYSILLEKGKIPSDNPEIGDDQEITFMEIDGGEIFGKGSAHVRTLLKDNKSQILANTAVYYSFSENFEDQQLVTSDENGYITIKTPELSNTRSETEVHALTAYLKLHEGDDEEILNYALKMKVNVYPLSYSQSWELGVGGTLGAALGPGAGVGIGAADVKVQLAGLKGELGVTGTLSVENSYENGKRTLSLSQNYGAGVSGSAEIGPAATVGVLGTDLALKPVVVSGNAETNTLGGIGLKIDNYDPLNEEQVRSIGKFLLSYLATARGNLFLLCALGADYFNQFSTTENLGAGVGAGIASVEYEGNSLGETTNLEAGALRSYSINYDLGENSQEKVFELTREFNAKLGALIGDQLFSEGVDSSMKVETTHTDGNLDNLVVGRTISTEKNSLFIREEVASKSIEVSYSSDDAAQIFQEIPKLESFARGKTRYFFGKMPKTMLSSIDKSSATGEYTESEEKTTIYSKDFEISAQLGVGVEVGAEFEGVGKYSYETEKGTYSNGRRNVSYSASSDLGDLVVSQKIGIKELLTEPLETMASVIENDLRRVSAKIEEGVVIVDAYIRCKAEEAKEWVVHMIALNKDKLSRTTVQSYSIATVSLEEEEAPGVALTVGDPYIVYVTDEDGEEVTDYSECPLELTLSYTPEMLQAAKATASDAKNLGIYMHVDEKAGYVYVGGTVDEANQQVTVEITKPGQYILAIDTLAPRITDFNVSDSSSTPTINVSFDENSAFSDFSMELDGKEIVNAENWEEYYNGSLRRISYSVETELSDGEHEVSVYAVDSAGNAMKQAAVFTFTVDTELPELSKLTVSVDEDVLRVRAWSDHMDITNAYAKVQWKDADENIITEEYMMDVMDGYYTVMCEPEEDALFATVSVITTDANGNRCESEEIIKNLENPELNSSNDLWIRFVDGSGETRSEYEYIGKAIKPVVQIYEGTELLKEKTDYTLSFKNNTNAGTATITVKAKGNYQGQDTENFTILPKDIAEEDVIAGNISCVANGKTQLKVPTIKFGKLTLSNKKNKDFSVTWPDTAEGAYKDVGTYVIKVTGNGNYTGERDIQLLIGGKTVNKLSVSKISTQTYTGTAIEIPNLVVKDGKKELINGTDYMVSYKDNVEIGTAKLIITGIGGYYVGTKEISFKIQGISMSKVKVDATSLPKTVIYNGEEQTPELRLYYQKNKTAEIEYLVKDMHYKVTYHKNVNVGSAQIIIEGMGKYSGTMKKSFKITPFDVKKNENGRIVIELDDIFVYAKGGVKPEPVVKFGDNILTLGKDYTLAYANNKAVTTEKTKKLPTVTVKFKGNYKGSRAEIFEIIGQSLEELTIFVKDKVYSTKKNAWKSAPVIKDLDGKVLKLGTDYEKIVSYYTDADCTAEVGNEIPEAGTYIWVKAEGKGNYAGSCIVGKYRITTSSITKAKVKIEKQYYTGKAIEPKYDDITSVVVNKQELTAGKDYEIVENSYQKNVKVGTATMQIKGIGNYGDVLTVKYSIQKKNFIWRWFEGLF